MSEEEEFEFRLRYEKEQAQAQPANPTGELSSPVTGMRAALDATRAMGQATFAAPASGIAGLAGAALPGPAGQGADWQRRVQEMLSHQPQTPGSQSIVDTATAPFQWLANKADQAGGWITDATGSPAIGAAVNAGIQFAPALIGKGAQKPVGNALRNAMAELAGAKSRNSVKDTTYKAAIDEGYLIPQSEYNPTFIGNRVESIGGKAAIKQQAEIANQQITNSIARREAGLGPDQPLTELTLKEARDRIAAPYREVEALPGLPAPRFSTQLNPMRNPYPLIGKTPKTPKELVHDWKTANSNATELWRDYRRNYEVETLDKYRAALKEKAAIEENIDKAAIAAGRPDLVPKLKDARVRIAKNYSVERSLNEGGGSVDALVFGKMRDKQLPLSGGLKTIGDFAAAFPRLAREESKVPAAGVSKSEAIAASLFGAGGGAMLGPWGYGAAALPLIAPPAARALALGIRRPKSYAPGLGLRMTDTLARGLSSVGLVGMTQDQ